jgi:NAD(P)-dependent dehydrogenase (short-subunit alcohol dehydrogenase family)
LIEKNKILVGRDDMSLAGKKVAVVGGSSSIGLATVALIKREGAEVVIVSRNAECLKAAADKLGARTA